MNDTEIKTTASYEPESEYCGECKSKELLFCALFRKELSFKRGLDCHPDFDPTLRCQQCKTDEQMVYYAMLTPSKYQLTDMEEIKLLLTLQTMFLSLAWMLMGAV
jgi:hypothetical protein